MYSSPHPSVHLLSLLFLPPMRTHPITRENPSLRNPYTSTSTSTSSAGYISRLLSWEIFPDWAFFLFLTPFCRREGRKEGPGRRVKRRGRVSQLELQVKAALVQADSWIVAGRTAERHGGREKDRTTPPFASNPLPIVRAQVFYFPRHCLRPTLAFGSGSGSGFCHVFRYFPLREIPCKT